MSECTAWGCDRPRSARGLCQLHYSRWYRNGAVERVMLPVRRVSPYCSCCGMPDPNHWKGCNG